MAELHKAEAAAREALQNSHATANERPHWLALEAAMSDLLAALDAARGEAVAWCCPQTICDADGYPEESETPYMEWGQARPDWQGQWTPLFAAPPAALAVPAANVTPMRQPRADLLAALDAARGEAVAWQFLGTSQLDRQRAQWKHCEDPEIAKENGYEVRPLYAAPPAAPAVPASLTAELAARLDKVLGCHADSMPKEAYFEVDAVMRALQAQPPAAAVPEGYALAPVEPTREMRKAGLERLSPDDCAADFLDKAWPAMLAAANKENTNG